VSIDPILGISQGQEVERPASPANSAASSAGSNTLRISNQDSGDRANLSADAQQLSNLSQALTKIPQIRQERVAPLSRAVQSGTYAVQNQQVAQSMLGDFRMTSGSQP
jgi:flagellar biosynthesis anti-sigma factor FlgM